MILTFTASRFNGLPGRHQPQMVMPPQQAYIGERHLLTHPLDVPGLPYQGPLKKTNFPHYVKTDEINLYLRQAVEKPDCGLLEYFISRGAGLETKLENGLTPLLHAIFVSNTRAVVILLKKGARVDATDPRTGNGPLHFAARSHIGTDAVSLIIDRGAALDLKNAAGMTPAALCVEGLSNPEMLEILLKRGANPNADFSLAGTGMLHHALSLRRDRAAELLVIAGADTNKRDLHGKTPLSIAAGNGNQALIKLLLEKGTDRNARNDNGDSILLNSICSGDEETAISLINGGSDTGQADASMNTALHLAAASGSIKICKALVKKGCKVDAKNRFEETPLFSAAYSNSTDCVAFLEQAGAKTETRNCDGSTAAQAAARIAGLENAGNRMNARKDARQELRETFHFENKISAEILVRKIDAIDLREKAASDFLTQAIETRRLDLVNMIIAKASGHEIPDETSSATLVNRAVENGLETTLRKLSALGIDVNARHDKLVPAIELAFMKKNIAMARTLFDLGYDLRWKSREGMTGLHMVVCSGTSECFSSHEQKKLMEKMISKGVAVDSLGGRFPSIPRATALQMAVIRSDIEAARTLLANGARPDICGPESRSPLHEAALAGDGIMLAEMLRYDRGLSAKAETILEEKEYPVDDKYRESRKDTPLHSVAKGFIKALEAAISAGDPTTNLDKFVDAADALISAEASAKALDEKGRTPSDLIEGFDLGRKLALEVPEEKKNKLMKEEKLNSFLLDRFISFDEKLRALKNKLK